MRTPITQAIALVVSLSSLASSATQAIASDEHQHFPSTQTSTHPELFTEELVRAQLGAVHGANWNLLKLEPHQREQVSKLLRKIVLETASDEMDSTQTLLIRKAIQSYGQVVEVDPRTHNLSSEHLEFLEEITERALRYEYGDNSLLYLADSLKEIPSPAVSTFLNRLLEKTQSASAKEYIVDSVQYHSTLVSSQTGSTSQASQKISPPDASGEPYVAHSDDQLKLSSPPSGRLWAWLAALLAISAGILLVIKRLKE